jgi:hypothetical protein
MLEKKDLYFDKGNKSVDEIKLASIRMYVDLDLYLRK